MINDCPKCESTKIKKNGKAKNGKQQYHCNECGAGFVKNPQTKVKISEEKKQLIENALKERLSLRAICRMFSVSLSWLYLYMLKIYAQTPANLGLNLETTLDIHVVCIAAEADELWSFVGTRKNKVWIWIIMDRKTKQVIAFHVGKRTKRDAKKLWDKVPLKLKNGMIVYTDFLKSYKAAIPKDQHVSSGKDAGNTNHIERLNCTIRQRVSRLVRETLSFSKKLANHIGAIGHFLFNYNKELQVA